MRTGIDCFAGIGGFSLAMERTGIKVVAQIEIDPYCQKVLKKNFPKAKRFRDICAVSANDLRRYRPFILCGGFPCQDISSAGKGVGANEGERSGLWREMWRLIRTTRPTWLLIENVPALRTRGADSVLIALEALGYTAWSLVVGALHVGAPHQRQRVWIVAHAESDIRRAPRNQERDSFDRTSASMGNTKSQQEREPDNKANAVTIERTAWPLPRGPNQHDWECPRVLEPGLDGTTHGISGRLDRLKALGNAIVPQVAEAILRSIIAVDDKLIK